MNLSQLFDSETYKILSAPTYPLAEASRLVKISPWRVGAWLRGYEYSYKIQKATTVKFKKQKLIVRPKDINKEAFASFLDLVDLLFVKRFLEQGFSLQHVRKALEEARVVLDIPHFASSRFFTLGKNIFVEEDSSTKHLYTLLTGGQFAFSEIVEKLGNRVDFEDTTGFELAARWYPLGKEGKIVIDPQVAYGRPTIIGKGTKTANIYDMYKGEREKVEVVGYWLELPTEDVDAAVRFEQSLVAA